MVIIINNIYVFSILALLLLFSPGCFSNDEQEDPETFVTLDISVVNPIGETIYLLVPEPNYEITEKFINDHQNITSVVHKQKDYLKIEINENTSYRSSFSSAFKGKYYWGGEFHSTQHPNTFYTMDNVSSYSDSDEETSIIFQMRIGGTDGDPLAGCRDAILSAELVVGESKMVPYIIPECMSA